jgi:myo-inositol-1(or 4)-monophosphatase
MNTQKYQSPYTAIAIEAAMKAGAILKKGFGTQFTISSKASINDLVTEFDQKAEDVIINHLKKHFPNHAFLAEESGHSEITNAEVRWIIDPLDGTMNFAHYIPTFCISIGAMIGNQIEIGIIYDPLLDELFLAEKGFGAYLNNKRIHVSPQVDIKRAILASGFPYTPGPLKEASKSRFIKFLENDNPLRIIGSAALTLAYIAAGRFDIYWGSNLKPWDVAAGSLLVEEAGGKLTHYDGSAHDMFQASNTLATNLLLHDKALAILR